jgi:ParB-like chromosome segregation protein Spo0J
MSKEKEKTERYPRKDVNYVPVTDVVEITEPIEFGGKMFGKNIREDYGDIPLLAQQIEENGEVRVPCRGFKKDGKYYLTDGHRRYRAAMMILEKTGHIISLPIMSELGITEDKRILDMIICNEGKPLNALEHSDAIFRLYEMEYTDADVMKQTGWTKVYVSNLKLLHKASNEVKQKVKDGTVSATLAMKLLREEKDSDKVMQVIETTVTEVKKTSKPKAESHELSEIHDENGKVKREGNEVSDEDDEKVKITDKDVTKAKGVYNSISFLKKALKKGKDNVVRIDNVALYNFATGLVLGKFSLEYLMNTLFEPLSNEQFKKNQSKQLKTFLDDDLDAAEKASTKSKIEKRIKAKTGA